MKKNFLTAEWKNLIMVNYIIDPKILLPYLPHKTELDQYQGNVYVSLIGFVFANTKMLGVPIPFHINFEEVNLRFYVRYNDNGVWKRGATFIKEIVPKPAISFVANTFYHEKYSTMPMKHFRQEEATEMQFGYSWKHKGKWNTLQATTEKIAVPMLPGSEEEFIAEHYWGYSRYTAQTTFEYGVEHPKWQVYPVKKYVIDCDFKALYGNEFSFLQNIEPSSVFVAAGSPIAVLHKRKL
jgi:uncharacterized protein